MAKTQEILMGDVQAVTARGSACGSVVFSRQEDTKGTSQPQRRPLRLEAPAVKRPDEEQECHKEMVARIQHISS